MGRPGGIAHQSTEYPIVDAGQPVDELVVFVCIK